MSVRRLKPRVRGLFRWIDVHWITGGEYFDGDRGRRLPTALSFETATTRFYSGTPEV